MRRFASSQSEKRCPSGEKLVQLHDDLQVDYAAPTIGVLECPQHPRASPSPPETGPAKEGKVSMSVEQLAPREREVLQLVADGLANKEIAARLTPPVTTNTVKGHLKRILLKLDVNCRTAAAAEWLKHRSNVEQE